MKAWELLRLLDEGKGLQKVYHNDPGCTKTVHRATYEHKNSSGEVYEIVHRYEFYGWGSACGSFKDHFLDLIEHSEEWKEVDKND